MVFAGLLLWVTSSLGEDAIGDSSNWRVWLEPRFMRAPVSAPIAGAHKTELAAGELVDGQLQTITKDRFQQLAPTWDEYSAKARQNASADLAELKPEYVRNKRKVIDYAMIRSEKPIVASAVLAPEFLKLFEETMGPKVFLVVPSRYVAIVFPALASRYREFYPLVFREYRASAFPVSVEVFELSAEGMKAVGVYEEP
jgi:hypothetical protein